MIKGLEVARLRSVAMDSGIDYSTAYQISEEASSIIDEALDNLIQSSIQDAINYAEDMGAKEFAEDFIIVEVGGSKRIESRSGSFIYSNPEIKNLHNLVRNGEISKDGNKYKKIPVGKPSIRSSLDQMRAQQNIQSETRRAMLSDTMGKRLNSVSSTMGERIRQRMATIKEDEPVEIKTASSKQDPNESWIIPAREIDLTDYMNNINRELEVATESVIIDIVESFIREIS